MKKESLIMSRNPNFKSYGRGKHSNHPGTVVNSSIQFDKLFFANSNKPTASKSAGTVGKWGVTSFTSLRSSSFTVGSEKTSRFSSLGKKRTQPAPDAGIQVKRPVLSNNTKRDGSPMLGNRKFFKSRNVAEDPNQKSYKNAEKESKKAGRHTRSADENKKQKHNVVEQVKVAQSAYEKSTRISTKKAVAAKIVEEPVPVPSDYQKLANHPSPTKDRDKPPIVLRIFKGTSQLVSETGNKSDSSDDEKSSIEGAEKRPSDNEVSKENVKENNQVAPEPEPEPVVLTRSLRRRSPEKIVEILEPISSLHPVPGVKSSRKIKSPSPTPPSSLILASEPATKTRSARRRSPPKSKSPSPEPAITTRSLRRRPAPAVAADTVAQPELHTSPKRTLRSTKNAPPPAGKIVITNLHSDNPSVILSDDNATPAPIPSPSRKEPKEYRSYSNKHKHKSKNGNMATVKVEQLVDVAEEKVEDLLATIEAVDDTKEAETAVVTQSVKVPETTLDEDRAELLHLLEDDDDFDVQKESIEQIAEENNQNATIESQLRIKIKLPKSSVKEEPIEVPVIMNAISDSQHSCTDVKSDLESNLERVLNLQMKTEDTKAHVVESCTVEERTDSITGCETEVCNDSTSISSSSAPVAAVTNKKGSFFKHRSSNDGNKKRLGMALYKHKWIDDKDAANNVEDDKNNKTGLKSKTVDNVLDLDLDDEMPLTKFIRQPAVEKFDFDDSPPVMGVKCSKKNKDFYTVVRNVKRAHQIQESGEFQEFNDDVDYILDALQDNNPIGTRCLSAITLATKCTEPAFRMHVRAHGTVTKFFRTLHDATKDQSLGLCTATVMFVLSQDRLNMDLDRDSLELMLNLLESDASHTKALEDCGLTDSQLTKTKDKVRQICADIQSQGHAKHLNLDNITVGHLSMETLLSLTSKRAGEWFKEELRELGGLEHIIRTVVECCKHVDDTANAWSVTSLEKIRKVDRCLRVLENVTMLNEQNNDYLLEYQNGILIDTLVRMFKVCDYEIPLYPTYSILDKDSTGAVLRECLIANLKVLINVTHDYQNKSHGSSVIGNKPGVIESSLHVLLQVPQYIPKEEKFDLMLLTLIMLINLVEHCDLNRKAIIEAKAPSDEERSFETKEREPAVKALISTFYNYEELARNEEKKTDAILEGENAEKPPTNAPQKVHEDFIEETISQLVQKAGQNMEHTLIAAYVAMLIGYLIIDNEDYEKFVRNHVPEKNFRFMVTVLQKFYSFMILTASGGTVSNRDMKSFQMVIQKLIESDRRHGFDSQLSQSTSTTEFLRSSDTHSESQSITEKTTPVS